MESPQLQRVDWGDNLPQNQRESQPIATKASFRQVAEVIPS